MPDQPQPEMLPGIVADQHRMFHPEPTGRLVIDRLRNELARLLTPYDGKPGYDDVLEYARRVYEYTGAEHEVLNVIGYIVIARVRMIRDLSARVQGIDDRPSTRAGDIAALRAAAAIPVIDRMSESLVQAFTVS